MIDFENAEVFKLKPIPIEKMKEEINQFLIDGEEVLAVFKSLRDQLVFTNKRAIATNVQGLTGSKVDYTSIPFSKVQTLSVETSGTLDMDCEIQLWLIGVGRVTFEIKGDFDLVGFNKVISTYALA